MRVVGGADPYRGEEKSIRRREVGGKESALLIHRFAVPLLQQEKAKAESGGTNMPSPVGEGGSRRLTDEAFFPLGEVLL